MTNEQKDQVIKALSYGFTVERVAEIAEIDINVVKGIAVDCAAEIAAERDYHGNARV